MGSHGLQLCASHCLYDSCSLVSLVQVDLSKSFCLLNLPQCSIVVVLSMLFLLLKEANSLVGKLPQSSQALSIFEVVGQSSEMLAR